MGVACLSDATKRDPDAGMDDAELYASPASANVPHPIWQRSELQAGDQSNNPAHQEPRLELGGVFLFPKRNQSNSEGPGPRSQLDLANREKDAQGDCRQMPDGRQFVKGRNPEATGEDEIGPAFSAG